MQKHFIPLISFVTQNHATEETLPNEETKYPHNSEKGVLPHKNKEKLSQQEREKKQVFSKSFLSHNLYSLPLPFGVISATKSSTVTCSSPFSLITSYAKAKNKSYHLK